MDLRRSLVSGTAALLLVSCGTLKNSTETTYTMVTPASGPAYTIVTRPQTDMRSFPKKDGWRILFDGSSLKGWRGYGRDDVPARWSLEDGCIKLASKANAPGLEGGDLIFDHRFAEFELELEWKIAKRGNSGIFYLGKEVRYTKNGAETNAPLYYSSPEYQLLDNANHPDGKKGVDGNRKSASLYDMIPAKPQNQKPYGEWNKVRITVKGGTVTHWQNGEKVLSYRFGTPEWTGMLEASKFASSKMPLAFNLLNGIGEAGYIGLQDHGNEIWFRNIRIKEL